MLKTVTGVYENGQIQLAESPQGAGRAQVIVTFLAEEAAAELRWRLKGIAEDWDRPETSVYDPL